MISKRNLIPVAILAALAVPGLASAHVATASGSCQGGVAWSATNYDKTVTNTIVVRVDGTVVHQDLDFKASDTGSYATDKTKPHAWSVDIDAPGTQYDRHLTGSYAACVVATTTTTVAPTTTTSVPATTTTVTSTTVAVTTTEASVAPAPPTTGAEIPCVQDSHGNWVFQGTPNPCQGPFVPASIVAVDLPPVPPANLVLPATGPASSFFTGAAIGIALVAVGAALVAIARRRTA